MTIRYRLLFSYIFISLTSSILVTLMFFTHFSEVMSDEIKSDLKIEALSMMEEIDGHLFERIQNIMLWRNLQVMQDIRVGDVDKRLAYLLKDISDGYQGMYPFLLVRDKKQQLVASSERQLKAMIPDIRDPSWQAINAKVSLQTGTLQHNFLSFAVSIPDQFIAGELGYLYAGVDWEKIYHILESPLPFQQKEENSYTVIVDKNNQIIAASNILRQANVLFAQLPKEWNLSTTDEGIQQISMPFLETDKWLVSWASSTGYRSYKGLGWKVIVMTPLHNALEPVLSMWKILLVFIAFTTVLAAVVSLLTAQRIAKPIMQLAHYTQSFMLNKKQPPPTIKATGEIAELSKQFTLMINDLEKSQQDKVRMAKFSVIAEMSATMAHEIRTPLGILRSSAQMLQREKDLSPIAEEMLGFISSETTRLNELVTHLLESSRPHETELIQQPLRRVIEHAIDLLASKIANKGVLITLEPANSTSEISYDWDQMLQVFLNLITNAIQHIETSGRILIELTAETEFLCIKLSDDGSGISDSEKESVFDPFFTQRKDGIGLGLMVVQQIVIAHQGRIEISDSQWGGACFTLYFPWHKQEQ
ncbi:MAG: hypothetical protein GQ582_06935 [Methyloprofundus sp.]|nr:hypothetical protein [Methyloprofundus sp.]